mmetsp:Transcript_11414/g.32382  ORF Transcript_11414/g.32382 Transcript_11414/m.32382 type:complete len:852 (-) Transcript_11414:806-3361(-)
MDFHPSMHTLLLVGTAEGTVSLLALAQQEALFDIRCRTKLLMRDTPVTSVAWAPDGSLFGVAYAACKDIGVIHLYPFEGPGSALRTRTEVEAHSGGVNAMAVTTVGAGGGDSQRKLVVVTGGDDGIVRVWDAKGNLVHQTNGHSAPVLSICTARKGSYDFIFSTGRDGRIKLWLYSKSSCHADYSAPGRWCTCMLYSSDRKRVFSCGVGTYNGESTLVEWQEAQGKVSRQYVGYLNPGEKLARFDTAANRFILAGDDSHIKVWDMDEPGSVLRVPLDAELPAMPLVKVNPAANLVAVSTRHNEIKVLASPDGRCLLSAALQRKMPPCSVYISSVSEGSDAGPPDTSDNSSLPGASQRSGSLEKHRDSGRRSSGGGGDRTGTGSGFRKRQKTHGSKSRLGDSSTSGNGNSSRGGPPDPRRHASQCSLGLPTELSFSHSISKGSVLTDVELCNDLCCAVLPSEAAQPGAIARVLFSGTSRAVLALSCTGRHCLWECVAGSAPTDAAKASDCSSAWQPVNTSRMVNQMPKTSKSRPVSCLTVSNNGTYALSSSGMRVELYNLLDKESISHFQLPPPATTSLAFSPQDNNIIALGLEDSSICIYNARSKTCMLTLQGHSARVTGLAFSAASGALISAGADAKVCIWGPDGPGKDTYDTHRAIRLESSGSPLQAGEVKVYFHPNQNTFLTVHASQLAIHKASSAKMLAAWDVPTLPSAAPFILTDAAFSCDGSCVYVACSSGEIGVFKAPSLEPVCKISVSEACASQEDVFPTSLAAHPLPSHPSHLAVGLSDGTVVLLGLPSRIIPGWEAGRQPRTLPGRGPRDRPAPVEKTCARSVPPGAGPASNDDSGTYTSS